jgi:hypothetical protein
MAFVHPAAWLLGSLVAVLIALYLWERSRRRIDVPSLLLWRVVPDAVIRTNRFRPDWLFVLQCLLLGLLVAGLADPYLRDRPSQAESARIVFVLDASASMQAREGRESRFDLARAAIERRIATLGSDDEVMLIAAGQHPTVVATFSHDHADVLQRLAALEPMDTAANLDAALAIAGRAAEQAARPATVELFTDTPRDELAAQWRDRIGVVQIGETDDNLAIEGMQITQGRFQDYRDARAYVAVHNFAHREAHGVLTLHIDDAVFSRRGFTLAPRSVGGFPVGTLPAPGVLRASLEVDDALAADNLAYGYIRPTRALHVLAVTGSPGLRSQLERIAAATPNLQFTVVTPAEYQGAQGADVVLFHRFAPAPPADAASLYIAPEGDASPFPTRGAFDGVPVLDWNERHPVLAGVRPELPFALTSAQDVSVPAWAETVVSSRAAGKELALAAAGEQDGRRRAVLAFDIDRDDLLSTDHVNLLLLFFNLLDWLAPTDDGIRVVHTGEVEVVDRLPALPRHVLDPHGHESLLPADTSVALETPYSGEYRVAAGDTTMRVFANFADTSESDIGRARQGTSNPPPSHSAAASAHEVRGLSTWLYAAAAALMLLEWFAARRTA